jgi:hypothetical protein
LTGEKPFSERNEPYAVIASSFFHYELCRLLVKKELLTPEDAATVFNGTANNVRLVLAELDSQHKVDAVASTYERYSSAIMGGSNLFQFKPGN